MRTARPSSATATWRCSWTACAPVRARLDAVHAAGRGAGRVVDEWLGEPLGGVANRVEVDLAHVVHALSLKRSAPRLAGAAPAPRARPRLRPPAARRRATPPAARRPPPAAGR